MTATLLLRLAGPMQSWGTQSRFRIRDSGREPSKSGVVGLLCAAMGLSRSAPLADLAALRMGVRVDREGVARVDYQTAGGGDWLNGRYGVTRAENPGVETALSWRAYLSDADFLVGLEARSPEQEALLGRLDAALHAPKWSLFLGRKGYIPGDPVSLPGSGIVEADLQTALQGAAPSPFRGWDGAGARLRLIIETDDSDPDGELRADQPVSFVSHRRVFATRTVRIVYMDRPAETAVPR